MFVSMYKVSGRKMDLDVNAGPKGRTQAPHVKDVHLSSGYAPDAKLLPVYDLGGDR